MTLEGIMKKEESTMSTEEKKKEHNLRVENYVLFGEQN